jgi:diphosphomevalonate decarboxylase
MSVMLEAFREKDFAKFGAILEEDCLDMHHVMQTQNPPLMYWNETTTRIMDAVHGWRTEGLSVYFTIDAGPNVHCICEGKNEHLVVEALKGIAGIERIIVNMPSVGAHRVSTHLF